MENSFCKVTTHFISNSESSKHWYALGWEFDFVKVHLAKRKSLTKQLVDSSKDRSLFISPSPHTLRKTGLQQNEKI